MVSGFWLSDEQQAIVESVTRLCSGFDAEYWRKTVSPCTSRAKIPTLAASPNNAAIACNRASDKRRRSLHEEIDSMLLSKDSTSLHSQNWPAGEHGNKLHGPDRSQDASIRLRRATRKRECSTKR